MPYIQPLTRAAVDRPIPKYGRLPESAGELNYLITLLLHEYLIMGLTPLSYSRINEVIGVLECAKLELYRMIAAPYENKKRLENGPVSELDAIGLEEIR